MPIDPADFARITSRIAILNAEHAQLQRDVKDLQSQVAANRKEHGRLEAVVKQVAAGTYRDPVEKLWEGAER